MEKLVRRLTIIFLMGVVFAFTTSAMVRSNQGHLSRSNAAMSVACTYASSPFCISRF
jgi:hypothetical protein